MALWIKIYILRKSTSPSRAGGGREQHIEDFVWYEGEFSLSTNWYHTV